MGAFRKVVTGVAVATGLTAAATYYKVNHMPGLFEKEWGEKDLPAELAVSEEDAVPVEVRQASGNEPAPEETKPAAPHRGLPPAHLLAAAHPAAVAAIRAHAPSAEAAGGRFTDAELIRYAVASGWLSAAPDSAAAAKCLRAAAHAAWKTDVWLAGHVWAAEEDLERFASLAYWASSSSDGKEEGSLDGIKPDSNKNSSGNSSSAGSKKDNGGSLSASESLVSVIAPRPPPEALHASLPAHDDGDCPTLVLRVGEASRTTRGMAGASAYGNAIVTLVQRALDAGVLTDAPAPGHGGAQDMVVQVDAAGATVLTATRILPVVRHVALTMNEHYPGRLRRMELYNLPPFATWLVAAVRKLMHATTRDKVMVIGSSGAHKKA